MKQKNDSYALYKRLLKSYVFRYQKVLWVGGICMLVVALTTAAQAYMMKPVLDDIFIRKDEVYLFWIPILLILNAVLNSAGDYGQSLALKYVGQRTVSDMQGDLFAHLMHSDISLFHDQSSGRLISRLTNDIALMRNSVSQVLTGAIKESFTMVFLIGLMFYQSVAMSLMTLAIVIFGILPMAKLGRKMRKVADATQQQMADFSAQLDDTFQGVRVVKAYRREEFEIQRTRTTVRNLFKLYYKASRIQSISSPMMNLVGTVAIAVLIWYGGSQVITNKITSGDFFSFITAMLMAYRPMKVLASLNTQLQEGMAAAARFFSVIDIKPIIQDESDAGVLNTTKGEVKFDQVSFRYNEGSGGVESLKFTVPAGKTVALVGSSGSGKTTIMNLLLRFYEVGSGRITIDGQDITKVTLSSLRESLAFVSQDIVLFNDTVRANIAYGRLDATDDEIIEAAKKAHAHDFIMELPDGYNTQVGPAGVKLSGGQRQRLSIARAVLKNAPILLLDEATSALDNTSERAVQDALEELMEGRTTLVIAHRLSTIQDADNIIVLDRGHIINSGSHRQLIETSDIYRTMYQLTLTS